MKVISESRRLARQDDTDSAVPAMCRANGARLARHCAERASRNWAPQAGPFDGKRTAVARRARALIDAHFREPVRMGDLCRATGARVRTLQRCFRQYFGMTVKSYLKAVRLDAAYRDLIAAHPSRDTVTAIAERNGCSHLGRFSSDFRERFGQLPRETLRSEPSAFGQLRDGPQPASPSQVMFPADGPAPTTAQQGLEVA